MDYSNPRVDELFEMGRSTLTQEERKKAYFEIQEILARDLSRLSILHNYWMFPYRTDFQGFSFQDKSQAHYSLQGVWWTKGSAPTTTGATTTQVTTTVKPPEPTPAFPMTYATAIAVIAIIAVGGIYYWRKRGVGSRTPT
jgi:ABC-type transport system substrate-binding protein